MGGGCEGWEFTGTLTQPVFNELARYLGPPLRHQLHTHARAVAAPLLFPENARNVYQALHLNFYAGPCLTIHFLVTARIRRGLRASTRQNPPFERRESAPRRMRIVSVYFPRVARRVATSETERAPLRN